MMMSMFRRYKLRYSYLMFAAVISVMMASCGSSDDMQNDGMSSLTGDMAVNIDCSTQEAQLVQTRAGAVGLIRDDSDLQRYGVGVFAYYTGESTWATVGASTTPNFMYNQFVEYSPVGLDGSGNDIYGWVYSPKKYWPNDNQPADDSGATGSVAHSYLSFFAYAPYVETPGGDYGITALTANNATGAPKVTYKWVTDADSQVDLLWGTRASTTSYNLASGGTDAGSGSKTVNTDLTKQTTSEKVDFLFKHALSSFDIWVQRIYDETTSTGNHPENEVDTKIFVSKVSLTPSADFTTTADLDLSTGTWSGAVNTAAKASVLENSLIVDKLRGTTSNVAADIRDVELNKWGTTGTGVTETATRLNQITRSLIFIPQTVTLTPKLTYSFVTRDDDLQLGYLTDREGHRYKRITQEVTGTPFSITLESGKKYMMICYIGVESVRFEVVSVEDWDFPIRLTPSVTNYSEETIEKTVNED